MRLSMLSLAVLTPWLICSCMSTEAPSSVAADPQRMTASCNAGPAQFAVGQLADARLEEEARTRSGAKVSRVLKPDQMVTKEFNTARLNLFVDQSGRVVRVQCG